MAALPDSGIRTLDLSYCNITQKFVNTLIEQLCPKQQTGCSVELERSCCSICRTSDVSGLDAIKPLVGVDAVEWQGQRVGRETLFAKLRGDTAVHLRWIDSEGRPLSSTFQNKRELGMRWPDPKRLQACRWCGLPASPHATSGSRRMTRWKLDKRVHSLTSLNLVGNPLALSSQDMIHILEDNPQLYTLCGLTPGQTSVDWSPSECDPRKKTLIDCLLLAADLRVGRASAHVRAVDIGGNPLFPQLTQYLRTKGSSAKEHPSDMHVDVELCRWISVCRAIRERFDQSMLNEFNINGTGLQQADTAFCALTTHGLPTVRSSERWSMLERVSCDGWRAFGIDLEETLVQSHDGFSLWLREAIIHASMSHDLLPNRSWADKTLRRLDLGETCLQAKDILVLAESIAGDSLIALESLVVGEESTPENLNPHPRYELDSQWSHIDFTAQRYCNSLWPADLMLLGKWICKTNVMKNLRRLSLRSTGMERFRSGIFDPCVGGNACTAVDAVHGNRTCPSCRFRKFISSTNEKSVNVRAGHPSYPDSSSLDPYCYSLDVEDTNLVLSDKFLGAVDCKLIATWLSNINTRYRKLHLDGNVLSDSVPVKWNAIDTDVSGIQALGRAVHTLELLEEIDISSNLLGSAALETFVTSVPGASGSRGGLPVMQESFRLNISDNRVDAEGWRDFLDVCAQAAISNKKLAGRVSVIAKRNPILWTTCASCPTALDFAAVFPMQRLREMCSKLANKAADRSSGRYVMLRRVAADVRCANTGRNDRPDSQKTDDKSFLLCTEATDENGRESVGENCTDQEIVKVTGTPADWVKIWEQACVCLSSAAFAHLDISDVGLGSSLGYPREALQLLGQAIKQSDTNSVCARPLTIATDTTFNPDQPEGYVLSAESERFKCSALLGPEDCMFIAEWLTLPSIRPRIRQIHIRTLTPEIASSSIGVRGKLHLAQALAGPTDEYTGVDRPSQVEELLVDLAHTTVTLRSDQATIPGLRWTLRDLEGLTVGDVALLTGWICHPSVLKNLKRLELYSTGVESKRPRTNSGIWSTRDTEAASDSCCNQVSLSLSLSLSLDLTVSLFVGVSGIHSW